MRTVHTILCFTAALGTWMTVLAPAPSAFAEEQRLKIAANDNRSPAGTLHDGVLDLQLVMKTGYWHPEDETGPRALMRAFAEEGKAPVTPGPLIRVREGTEVRVSIHNPSKKSLVVHGLHTRPGDDKSPLEVPPGETRDARFLAGKPGTYYYWGSTTAAKGYDSRDPVDTQLVGALVVDPAGADDTDRIFVLNELDVPDDMFHEAVGTFVVNGKSWPYTERLTYRAGEHVRWRWINVSTAAHPMHLHGAYFDVVAAGDGEHQQVYDEQSKRRVVTNLLEDGATMGVEWVPEREGRWIFHCHLAPHFSPDNQLPQIIYPDSFPDYIKPPPEEVQAHAHHATMDMSSGGMAGLVMGITVLPGASASARKPAPGPARKIDLLVRKQEHGAGNTANLGYALRENGRETERAGSMPGPPVVLTQNEPVEITIVNQLADPTAVHWHGIELESYYDGVPGVGGSGKQMTPPIAPGSSFVARFTPPRAGTFIYHTHWHDALQLTKGLYGPLIILPPGRRFDPDTDRIFLISSDGPDAVTDNFLLNGSTAPAFAPLKTGTAYRLRFINITSDNPDMTVSLLAGDTPVQWRAVAKDGADLPESQRKMLPAQQRVSVGETYDYEFVPQHAGPLQLDVHRPPDKKHIITAIEVLPR